MKLFRTVFSALSLVVVAALLSACAARSTTRTAPELTAADFSNFVLTPTLITNLEAADAELRKLNINTGAEITGGDSYAELFRKLQSGVDAHPEARTILARYGFSSKEYARATLEMFFYELYIFMDTLENKKHAAELYAEFTPQQKANIDVLRQMEAARKK